MTEYARRKKTILMVIYFDNRFRRQRILCLDPPNSLFTPTSASPASNLRYFEDDYNIQIEFGDLGNFLAIISSGVDLGGTTDRRLNRKSSTLSQAHRAHQHRLNPTLPYRLNSLSAQKTVPLTQAAGEISAEFVMCYPPVIPLLDTGERITTQVIDYIEYSREKGSSLTGAMDIDTRLINVVTNA